MDICRCTGSIYINSSGLVTLKKPCVNCLRYKLHKDSKPEDLNYATYFQDPPLNDATDEVCIYNLTI